MVGRAPGRLACGVAKRLCHRAKYGRLLQIPPPLVARYYMGGSLKILLPCFLCRI